MSTRNVVITNSLGTRIVAMLFETTEVVLGLGGCEITKEFCPFFGHQFTSPTLGEWRSEGLSSTLARTARSADVSIGFCI
jgi:hypothetical protein